MAIPRDILDARLESFRMELSDARERHRTAAAWTGFADWRRRLDALLRSEFRGQWPHVQFKSLSFEPPPRFGYDPHLGQHRLPVDEAEAVDFFARACDESAWLLGRMLEQIEALIAPKAGSLEAGATSIHAPGGTVNLVQAGRVDGSSLQIGTTSSAQHHSVFKAATLQLLRQLRADSADLQPGMLREIEPLLTALAKSDSEPAIEAIVSAIAQITAKASLSADRSLEQWRADTGRSAVAPIAVPSSIVRTRLSWLKAELITAGGEHTAAAEWPEFDRWRNETLALLETAFGRQSWPVALLSSVQFHTSSGMTGPEPKPRGILGGMGRAFQDLELEQIEDARNRRYFRNSIPHALRVIDDVIAFAVPADQAGHKG